MMFLPTNIILMLSVSFFLPGTVWVPNPKEVFPDPADKSSKIAVSGTPGLPGQGLEWLIDGQVEGVYVTDAIQPFAFVQFEFPYGIFFTRVMIRAQFLHSLKNLHVSFHR